MTDCNQLSSKLLGPVGRKSKEFFQSALHSNGKAGIRCRGLGDFQVMK
jgi:hypothetical protein